MGYWDTAGKSDEWFTPRHVFEALGCRFDLDVASPIGLETSVPADRFLTKLDTKAAWQGFIWMNPPFGGRNGIQPWLDRFFAHGNGIALAPDRTSAPWFQAAWEKSDAVLFTRKLKFLRPDGSSGKSPSNGTALLASGEKGTDALLKAAACGLGILARPVGASQSRLNTAVPSKFAA